jgi:hypothetical protein
MGEASISAFSVWGLLTGGAKRYRIRGFPFSGQQSCVFDKSAMPAAAT